MKQVNKIAGLLLAAALLASSIAGCSKTASNSSYLNVDSKPVNVPYVMTVDGNKVSLDEYRYYFLNMKADADQGDSTYWTTNTGAEETLRENILGYIKSNYAIQKLAKDNNISLTDEEKATVSSDLASQVESMGGTESYNEALKNSYLTDGLYKSLLESEALSKKVVSALTADGAKYGTPAISADEMKSIIANDYLHVKHILISLDTDGTETKKNLAAEVLERAKSGEDFDSLVSQYNEDTGMQDSGYYFTDGMMVTEFETAAKALEVGGISDIVQSTYGYHIIKRLPLDDDYINTNIDTLISDYKSQILAAKTQTALSDDFESLKDSLPVTYSDQYNLITVDTLS